MDITLLPPSRILTHHSHLALLPSALPRYTPKSRQNPHVNHGYIPKPPKDGSSPITTLPHEIILEILSHLPTHDLLSVLAVSKRMHEIGLSPGLHRCLTLNSIPSPIPDLMKRVSLPAVRELTISLNPPMGNYRISSQLDFLTSNKRMKFGGYLNRLNQSKYDGRKQPEESVIQPLLPFVNLSQLAELNIPFSSTYLPPIELERILENLGGRLRRLDVRGSSLIGDGWISGLLDNGGSSNLERLDLGFTSISSLPSPGQLGRLKYISLSSCDSLSPSTLSDFLGDLPSTVEYLDLSRVEQVDYSTLFNLRVTREYISGDLRPTGLKEVRVVGIDHLTRRDIRTLKRWWEKQRRECLYPPRTGSREGRDGLIDWGSRELRTPKMVSRTPSLCSSSSSSSTSTNLEEIQTPLSDPKSLPSRDRPEVALPSRHSLLQSLSSSSPTSLISPKSMPSLEPTKQNSSRISRSLQPTQQDNDDREDMISIDIIHSAILESEDEDGYRKFIGEVVGGALELDVNPSINVGERTYVEVDE